MKFLYEREVLIRKNILIPIPTNGKERYAWELKLIKLGIDIPTSYEEIHGKVIIQPNVSVNELPKEIV